MPPPPDRRSARRRSPEAPKPATRAPSPGTGLARVLSKLGVCSRTEAASLIRDGRVTVDGGVLRDPESRVDAARARIRLDGVPLAAGATVTVMLNKPRGLVTTRHDPDGRETVYRCLEGLGLPYLAPVGRLDKASEGLLLLTNDTAFAQQLLDPASHLDKVYHVQIDRLADEAMLARLLAGTADGGERLAAKAVRPLRAGTRNSWLEIVLDEGRNRHIRRLLAAEGIAVLRLVRVAIGPLPLGDLAKGAVRPLTAAEVAALSAAPR